MKKYAAIATQQKTYRVAEMVTLDGELYKDWRPVWDIREFTAFEEADQIARKCAAGEFNQIEGQYINMR